jgi:outer membrane protein assembly factor BamD (BamD/ComL family)
VRLALLRSAEAAAAAFPGVEFDDRALLEAEARYEQVRSAFPVYAEQERIEDRLAGIRQQRAAKDFAVARWYERVNQAGAAEFYYRQVLQDWPDTTQAAEARSRLRGLGIEAGSAPEQESGT